MSTPPGGLTPWAARELMAGHTTRNWVDGAACAQTDPELFFPEKGQQVVKAKLVCFRCPVRNECLQYALTSPIRVDGIWGGTTPKQRQDMRRRLGVRTDNYYDRCGTAAGARRHYRRNEPVCADCKRAELLYNRELRAK